MLRALALVLALGALAPAAHAAPVARGASVVGSGTPASCTGAAFRNAVTRGGRITFDCGPQPVTITLQRLTWT